MPPKSPNPPPLFISILITISLLPQSQGWTLLWTHPDGSTSVEPGKWTELSHSCKAINNPKDSFFEFDSEEDPVTIFLYPNRDCSGSPSGQASHLLSGNASRAILSFEVVDESGESQSSTTITSTSPSTSTTQTATATSTPISSPDTSSDSNSDSDSDASVSAGAVGGIVAGIVVAAALIGAVIYFLHRRNRNTKPPSSYSSRPQNPDPGPAPGHPTTPTPTTAPGPPQTSTPSSNPNLITAAPYYTSNEPYSPAEPYAPQQLPYSPLNTSQPGTWASKSAIDNFDMASPGPLPAAPPGYMQHVVELDSGTEVCELSGTQMVSEIDGRIRGSGRSWSWSKASGDGKV